MNSVNQIPQTPQVPATPIQPPQNLPQPEIKKTKFLSFPSWTPKVNYKYSAMYENIQPLLDKLLQS